MIPESPTRIITRFSAKTNYEDLPEEVIHETKRILLDCFGCALAGAYTDTGRIAITYSRKLAGPPEARILGVGQKVSCQSAAFCNGELINALDYDPLPHVCCFTIPSTLAMAEREKASGKDLILAVTLALEVGSRIIASLPSSTQWKGKAYVEPISYGFTGTCFGATAGACSVLGFNQKKTANAFGITGQMVPVPSAAKWRSCAQSPMYKYGLAGWMAQVGVAAAVLTEEGFVADLNILDGERGFWAMYGAKQCKWERITQELGEEWYVMFTRHKPYPCCSFQHPLLDSFISIIEENDLKAGEIEKIILKGASAGMTPVRQNRIISTHVDAQFSLFYVFAAAAHRVKKTDWQDPTIMKDPKITRLMDKITFEVYPEASDVAYRELVVEGKPFMISDPAGIELIARNRTFKREVKAAKGCAMEGFAMTDRELKEKFRQNTSKALRRNKIDNAIKMICNLEKVDDVTKLTDLLST